MYLYHALLYTVEKFFGAKIAKTVVKFILVRYFNSPLARARVDALVTIMIDFQLRVDVGQLNCLLLGSAITEQYTSRSSP